MRHSSRNDSVGGPGWTDEESGFQAIHPGVSGWIDSEVPGRPVPRFGVDKTQAQEDRWRTQPIFATRLLMLSGCWSCLSWVPELQTQLGRGTGSGGHPVPPYCWRRMPGPRKTGIRCARHRSRGRNPPRPLNAGLALMHRTVRITFE